METAPETLGSYRLLTRLGVGGMAEVFLAESGGAAGFQKQLVIKRVLPHLRDDPQFRALFLDEARLAARLSHPSIAQTFQLGEVDGVFFIAMEHVPGITVSKLVRALKASGRTIPLGAALRLISQLLEALDYAHHLADENGKPLNIVHRDVSPSNIMVTPHGGVKLLDFGIARAASHEHQTRVGHTRGKIRYMAPEQARGDPLDGRADVFAVGAVLFFLMAGRTAYADRPLPVEELKDVIAGRRLKLRDCGVEVVPELERIIDKAMETRRDRRYQSAAEMARDIDALATAEKVSLSARPLAELMEWLPTVTVREPTPLSVHPSDVLGSGSGSQKEPHPYPDETPATGAPAAGSRWGAIAGFAALALLGLAGGAGSFFWMRSARVAKPPSPVAATAPEAEPAAPAPAQAAAAAQPDPAADEAPVEAAPLPVSDAPPHAAAPRPAVRATPMADSRKLGSLRVTAQPNATVWLKGRLLGTTPLVAPLPEGTHRIELGFPGDGPRRALLVNVVAGKETPVNERGP